MSQKTEEVVSSAKALEAAVSAADDELDEREVALNAKDKAIKDAAANLRAKLDELFPPAALPVEDQPAN